LAVTVSVKTSSEMRVESAWQNHEKLWSRRHNNLKATPAAVANNNRNYCYCLQWSTDYI